METLDLWGRASLDPRGLIGRCMQRTKGPCYILNIYAVGLMVSEKKIFKAFLHYKSMETLNPGGGSSLDPRGLIGRIYLGDH